MRIAEGDMKRRWIPWSREAGRAELDMQMPTDRDRGKVTATWVGIQLCSNWFTIWFSDMSHLQKIVTDYY